jgi:S-adenosylmethionine:tRNA ribosyltransferase-isomerase
MTALADFALPADLVAHEPPEQRGLVRDGVRMLVLDRVRYAVRHSRFDRISDFLRGGDLLVLNSSRTLPAVLEGRGQAGPVEVRLAGQRADRSWLALLLGPDGGPPRSRGWAGQTLSFGLGLSATVAERDGAIPRLWALRFSETGADLLDRLHRLGRPVRYEYVRAPLPLSAYQTVYARQPGSSEMPSAGRAFTWRVLFDLKRRGIATAMLVLHTGLSSYLDDDLDAQHPVAEEEYFVPEATAAAVLHTRRQGGRVVAVGTTVVRALESVADGRGRVSPGHGHTRLRITARHRLRAVDGLLTGLHEPQASHLDLLTAFVPGPAIAGAYAEAVARGYLWHEFGDLNLIL